jgi:hypothetical protein
MEAKAFTGKEIYEGAFTKDLSRCIGDGGNEVAFPSWDEA